MPEIKQISTITNILTSNGGVTITTSYLDETTPPFTIQARIAEGSGTQDRAFYSSNELLLQMINSPDHIDYILNDVGELILICDTEDSSNYSINADGELIYTTTE